MDHEMQAERMQFLSVVTVALISVLVGRVAVAQTCPSPIGSALTNPIRESSNTGFYLNLDNPALCSGTVVAWHFCYYRLIETNIATFAVYRQSPGGNYQELSESYRVVTRQEADKRKKRQTGFNCEAIPLPLGEEFDVQVGDVLGACLLSSNSDNPLRIQANSATGRRLFQPNFNTNLCQRNSLTSINQGDLQEVGSAALHLYADIANVIFTTATNGGMGTTTSSPVRPEPTPGSSDNDINFSSNPTPASSMASRGQMSGSPTPASSMASRGQMSGSPTPASTMASEGQMSGNPTPSSGIETSGPGDGGVPEGGEDFPAGAVAGAVAGVFLAVMLALCNIAVVVFLRRRRKTRVVEMKNIPENFASGSPVQSRESKIKVEMQENVAYKAHTESIPTAQNAAYNAVQSSEDNDQGYVINQLVYEEPNSSPVQSEESKTEFKMHENIAYKAHTESIPTTQNAAYNAVQSSEDNDQGYVINQLVYEEPRDR